MGYVQGMNIISSIIIYHGQNNIDESLQILKFLMQEKHFRDLYINDFELANKLAATAVHTLKLRCNDLYRHIVRSVFILV